MKRKVLVPINGETSERKKSADEIIAEAFSGYAMTGSHVAERTRAKRMSQFTYYWQESETVLDVVNKLDFVKTVEDAEAAADYIRRQTGLPLKPLPRERSY